MVITPMIPKSEIDSNLSSIEHSLASEHYASAAESLSELIAAERARLIGKEWREKIDVEETENTLKKYDYLIENDWDDSYEYLLHISTLRIGMWEVELETILFMRDGLELVARYLEEDVSPKLEELDRHFGKTVRSHKSMLAGVRQQFPDNICAQLPGHWWWRVDTKGIPRGKIDTSTDRISAMPKVRRGRRKKYKPFE